MKNLLSILLVLAMTACASASDRITLTLTVTNTPVYGDDLTINANNRDWTNSATATPQSLILIGANIGASATNLWRQIASYGYSGINLIEFSSSNVIKMRSQPGIALAPSISGTWATLLLETNVYVPQKVLGVPAASEPTPSSATNMWSQAASDIEDYSTNALTAGTKLLENIVQTAGTQEIEGDKSFVDTVSVGTLVATNFSPHSFTLSGNSPAMTFDDENGGTDERISIVSYDSGGFALDFYKTDMSSATRVLHVQRSGITATNFAILAPVIADQIYSTPIHNSSLNSTTTVTGSLAHTRANHLTLANGNNAGVDFGTKVYAKIKAGPTGAFAICGITGGSDGRVLIIHNSTAQNMTIANDSGVEPSATNRIYTGTGSDIATTGQGVITLIYDSEDSRWVVVSTQL